MNIDYLSYFFFFKVHSISLWSQSLCAIFNFLGSLIRPKLDQETSICVFISVCMLIFDSRVNYDVVMAS